jgi:hypothetical protein
MFPSDIIYYTKKNIAKFFIGYQKKDQLFFVKKELRLLTNK